MAMTVFFFSCKKDDAVTCTTCVSHDTLDFEVCRETDGNASVNGENTGTLYEVYIADLEDIGVTCGS